MIRKPLKRHEGLKPLSREHHQGLMVAWNIQKGLSKAIDLERIERYLRYQFETLLKPHFAFEERKIFSLLPENHALRQEAERDHRELRLAINHLTQHDDFSNYASLLRKHIRFEERILFEFIQQEVEEDQLKVLEGEWSENLSCLNWEDPFWK